MNVRVDWDQKARGIDGPQPEVDAVRWANHPAEPKKKAFARAAGARIGDQMFEAGPRLFSSECIRQARDGTDERLVMIDVRAIGCSEHVFER